ncbi:MAG: efflux RND transporter permease subunit [Pseudobdellovibrio sp.]
MSLSKLSIKRPVLAWMMMATLIIFGLISGSRMGISQLPDVNFPVVNISLTLDNAAPEVMEMNVVDVVENAVMGIEGLKNVTSNISQGQANITCEFELNHDIDVAMQEVQSRVVQVQNKLPTKLDPPVITKTNPEDQPLLWVLVSADQSIPREKQMIYARDTLKDQFSTISGVGSVNFAGYVEPNLRVWIDPDKLKKFDLTSGDVITAIQNEQLEQPAGRIETEKNELNVRVMGESKSIAEFSRISINSRGGGPNYKKITIGDVARVEEGLADVRQISRFNGKSAVGLGIVKQHGANAVEVSDEIQKKIETIKGQLLPGYDMKVQLDTTQYVKDSVGELKMSLILAALLTAIVCYAFLGSWSSTVNVLFSIPTSILGALIFLYFMGFTLNTFTLLGLSLAIGIVVDDAIMMLENIVRHFELGLSRVKAAVVGSEEITFSALAATLAIAAIFIPVVFMKGVIGEFFYQYGITVTAAVFLSLFEALTLTPMRSSRFLETVKHTGGTWISVSVDRWMDSLTAAYRNSLAWVLERRFLTLSVSIALFLFSLLFVSFLNQELLPSQDQSLFLLNVENPVGTSITESDRLFKLIEEGIKQNKDVSDIYSTIGNFNNNDVVNAGSIYVALVDKRHRTHSQREVMDDVKSTVQKIVPDAKVYAQDLSLAGMSASRGYPIEFTVRGNDWKVLESESQKLIDELKKTGYFEDFNTDFQGGMPEILVIPDREKAAVRGMTFNSISTEIGSLIGGSRFGADTAYPIANHRYDIRLRAEDQKKAGVDDIGKILIRNNRSGSDLIPVKEASEIKVEKAMQLISRFNRERSVPVHANVTFGKSQQEALKIVERKAKEVLSPGYTALMTGSAQAFQDSLASLSFALIFGIIVAYMILASQFNSFIHPVTVLTALPFSLSGALLALFITHQSINLYSMIGLILLMGLVKKNSILLVDFTNQKRREGRNLHEALLEACPIRLRPILMTSIATIAGAVPGALALGPGSEARIPMSVAIIGGVCFSTFMTLYVVPVIYSYFSKLERPEDFEEVL